MVFLQNHLTFVVLVSTVRYAQVSLGAPNSLLSGTATSPTPGASVHDSSVARTATVADNSDHGESSTRQTVTETRSRTKVKHHSTSRSKDKTRAENRRNSTASCGSIRYVRISPDCPNMPDHLKRGVLNAVGRKLRLSTSPEALTSRTSVFEITQLVESDPGQNVYLLRGHDKSFLRASAVNRKKSAEVNAVLRQIKDKLKRFRWGLEFTRDTPCQFVKQRRGLVQRQCFVKLFSLPYRDMFLRVRWRRTSDRPGSEGETMNCDRFVLSSFCSKL